MSIRDRDTSRSHVVSGALPPHMPHLEPGSKYAIKKLSLSSSRSSRPATTPGRSRHRAPMGRTNVKHHRQQAADRPPRPSRRHERLPTPSKETGARGADGSSSGDHGDVAVADTAGEELSGVGKEFMASRTASSKRHSVVGAVLNKRRDSKRADILLDRSSVKHMFAGKAHKKTALGGQIVYGEENGHTDQSGHGRKPTLVGDLIRGQSQFERPEDDPSPPSTGRSGFLSGRSGRSGRSWTTFSTATSESRPSTVGDVSFFAFDDRAEIAAQSPPNKWSRPKKSQFAPLRSTLLDRSVHNIEPSRSLGELRHKRGQINKPHMTCDIDGDGTVGPQDLRLARMFDTDGNGVIDSREWERGKEVLAREFFKNNQKEVWKYGLGMEKKKPEENVQDLLKARHFSYQYADLKKKERMLRLMGSRQFGGCMKQPGLKPTDSFTDLTRTVVPTPRGNNTKRVRTRTELLRHRRKEFAQTADMAARHNFAKSAASRFDPCNFDNKKVVLVDFMVAHPKKQLQGSDRVLQVGGCGGVQRGAMAGE